MILPIDLNEFTSLQNFKALVRQVRLHCIALFNLLNTGSRDLEVKFLFLN